MVSVDMKPLGSTTIDTTNEDSFAAYLRAHEPRLRRALVARYGAEIGREAAADALSYAWEHWDRLRDMDNPTGYLYRVGQSKARRQWSKKVGFPPPDDHDMPWIEPGLPKALAALSARQRQVVVLVHGFEYTHSEVAELLGISRSSVQNHVERGLAALRTRLEVPHA